MITFCGNKEIRTQCPLHLMNKHPKLHSTLGLQKRQDYLFQPLPLHFFPDPLLLRTFDCRIGHSLVMYLSE